MDRTRETASRVSHPLSPVSGDMPRWPPLPRRPRPSPPCVLRYRRRFVGLLSGRGATGTWTRSPGCNGMQPGRKRRGGGASATSIRRAGCSLCGGGSRPLDPGLLGQPGRCSVFFFFRFDSVMQTCASIYVYK